jgi:hypothetical protein
MKKASYDAMVEHQNHIERAYRSANSVANASLRLILMIMAPKQN